MILLLTIVNYLLWASGLISIVASFVLMSNVKSKVPKGQQDMSPLTPNERNYVLLMAIFSPIITSTVFYYGWKKRLPVKAKSANNWGWLGLLIAIGIFVGLNYLYYFAAK